MGIGNSFSPTRTMPLHGTTIFDTCAPTNLVLTTAGGVRALTPAQLMSGLLVVDTQDAQTANLPNATALNDAIPGVTIGTSFKVTVLNYGDSVLTVGLGTGITKPAVAGVSSVLTLATLTGKEFRLVCTGVKKNGDAADAWQIFTVGVGAAVVA